MDGQIYKPRQKTATRHASQASLNRRSGSWDEYWDESSRRTFYHNVSLGLSAWDRPQTPSGHRDSTAKIANAKSELLGVVEIDAPQAPCSEFQQSTADCTMTLGGASEETYEEFIGRAINPVLSDTGYRGELKEIIKNRDILVVGLSGKAIGDDSARLLGRYIGYHDALQILSLDMNRIGDRGAKAIASALSDHKSLVNLGLRNNRIRDDGAIAIANMLRRNNTITTLCLGSNPIGSEAEIAIKTAWTGVCALHHDSDYPRQE